MSQFKIYVADVIDNADGTAKFILEFDDSTKEGIKQLYGWKRWSSKKFEQLFIEGLHNYIKSKNNSEGSSGGDI